MIFRSNRNGRRGSALFAMSTACVMATTTSLSAVSPPPPPGCGSQLMRFENNTEKTISDGMPNIVTSVINASGSLGRVWDVDVQIFVTHADPRDLDIALATPAGTIITLTTDNGHPTSPDCFDGVIFDDQADPGGDVPYTNNQNLAADREYVNTGKAIRLVPEEPLGGLFIFEQGDGPWTLVISDDAVGDGGILSGWALDITTVPGLSLGGGPTPQPFENNNPIAINAGAPNVIQSTIQVGTLGGSVGDFLCTLILETDISHTNNADLDITLTSPQGTVVTLTSDNGSTFDDVFAGTEWQVFANLINGQLPYTDNPELVTDHPFMNLVAEPELTPEESFSAFTGENPIGVWILTISDDLAGNGGTLNSWKLTPITCEQEDADDDGVGNDCDNCPDDANANQADGDGDGIGDACDDCFGDNATGDDDSDGVCNDQDLCEGSDDGADADADGVPDDCDNSPNAANPDQADADGDGIGDASDACIGDNNSGDDDGDGVCNNADNCQVTANADQADGDGDGTGDACEGGDGPSSPQPTPDECCGGGMPAMMPFMLLGWGRVRKRRRNRT